MQLTSIANFSNDKIIFKGPFVNFKSMYDLVSIEYKYDDGRIGP